MIEIDPAIGAQTRTDYDREVVMLPFRLLDGTTVYLDSNLPGVMKADPERRVFLVDDEAEEIPEGAPPATFTLWELSWGRTRTYIGHPHDLLLLPDGRTGWIESWTDEAIRLRKERDEAIRRKQPIERLAHAADRIGCIYATHVGEMPSIDEARSRIIASAKKGDFADVAAMGVFVQLLGAKGV